jgi:maltose-binding protein MalE
MTYLVAVTEVVYDEEYLIKEMLETGEYGINAHPISHEAMVEFVKDREWQIEHHLFLDRYKDVPVSIAIKDEDGTDVFFAKNKMEMM